MKATQRILLSAGLATVVVGQPNATAPWALTYDFSTLQGDEALAYLFNYDPSVPHQEDTPYRQHWSSGDELPALEVYRPWYDVHYVNRLCFPTVHNGEAYEKMLASSPCKVGMLHDECSEYIETWESHLAQARQIWANSPYPCERIIWIARECGVGEIAPNEDGVYDYKTLVEGKGTLKEQHECLCKGDYWAALRACSDCQNLHIGNATLKDNSDRLIDLESSSICGDAATATKGLRAYMQSAWESIYPGHDYSRGVNYTIVSDGAQNKTDLSLYMTESVDFVPATIQKPEFTRTVDGKAVVMTPGPLKGNAKAKAGSAPAVTEPSATTTAVTGTGSAAAAATSEAGAADLKIPGGLVAAVFGAVFML